MNKTILITGAAGFFGRILTQHCLNQGFNCIGIDIEPMDVTHHNLTFFQADITNKSSCSNIFAQYGIDGVVHCAALLAHLVKDKQRLWHANVEGTRYLIELCKQFNVSSFIYISSNCLWGHNFHRPVTEQDIPKPVEIYGESKWAAEQVLEPYKDDINIIIFRCPTIIDEGRLGLLSILFEFIYENRSIWVLGGGKNKYQFIYAKDFAVACVKALSYPKSSIFNIGSDHVKSFKAVYQAVINKANTRSTIKSLPKSPMLVLMRIAYWLKLSPLGPYQYKMIAEDFIFDTTKIKTELNWKPTLTNEDMLFKSYNYYHQNITQINQRTNVSAHRQTAKMGLIRLLKWLS